MKIIPHCLPSEGTGADDRSQQNGDNNSRHNHRPDLSRNSHHRTPLSRYRNDSVCYISSPAGKAGNAVRDEHDRQSDRPVDFGIPGFLRSGCERDGKFDDRTGHEQGTVCQCLIPVERRHFGNIIFFDNRCAPWIIIAVVQTQYEFCSDPRSPPVASMHTQLRSGQTEVDACCRTVHRQRRGDISTPPRQNNTLCSRSV